MSEEELGPAPDEAGVCLIKNGSSYWVVRDYKGMYSRNSNICLGVRYKSS